MLDFIIIENRNESQDYDDFNNCSEIYFSCFNINDSMLLNLSKIY